MPNLIFISVFLTPRKPKEPNKSLARMMLTGNSSSQNSHHTASIDAVDSGAAAFTATKPLPSPASIPNSITDASAPVTPLFVLSKLEYERLLSQPQNSLNRKQTAVCDTSADGSNYGNRYDDDVNGLIIF